MNKNKKYWFCLIGPIDDNKIPSGGDCPPRKAAENAILKMCNIEDKRADNIENSSGWGVSELRAKYIRAAATIDEEILKKEDCWKQITKYMENYI